MKPVTNTRKFTPIPKDIGDYVTYSEESSSGLINKVHRSNNAKKGQESGAISGSGYCMVWFENKSYRTHRIVYFLKTGADPQEKQVDHIDGNKLNNKISNLRLATHRENNVNKKKQKNNTSGVTGVSWNIKRKKYAAQIKHNSKTFSLGLFDDFDKAVAVRIAAEHKFHQEYRSNHNDQYKLTPELLEWGKQCLEDKIERLNWKEKYNLQ